MVDEEKVCGRSARFPRIGFEAGRNRGTANITPLFLSETPRRVSSPPDRTRSPSRNSKGRERRPEPQRCYQEASRRRGLEIPAEYTDSSPARRADVASSPFLVKGPEAPRLEENPYHGNADAGKTWLGREYAIRQPGGCQRKGTRISGRNFRNAFMLKKP